MHAPEVITSCVRVSAGACCKVGRVGFGCHSRAENESNIRYVWSFLYFHACTGIAEAMHDWSHVSGGHCVCVLRYMKSVVCMYACDWEFLVSCGDCVYALGCMKSVACAHVCDHSLMLFRIIIH